MSPKASSLPASQGSITMTGRRPRFRVRSLILAVAIGGLILQRDVIWPPAFNGLANRALNHHQPEAALEWLEIAEWFGSQRADTALLRVRASRQIGDPTMIINSMHEAEKQGADSLKLQRERILCAAQSGQMSIAGRHLASLLTDPDYDNKDVCRAYIAGFLRIQKLPSEATQLDVESLILDSRGLIHVPDRERRSFFHSVLTCRKRNQVFERPVAVIPRTWRRSCFLPRC